MIKWVASDTDDVDHPESTALIENDWQIETQYPQGCMDQHTNSLFEDDSNASDSKSDTINQGDLQDQSDPDGENKRQKA